MTDKDIIKALKCCANDEACDNCPFTDTHECEQDIYAIEKFALDLITRQQAEIDKLQELVDDMSDYFPACIGCEGKTEFGERTDKCVYLIDDTNYCAKRGIKNIASIQKENQSLKAEVKKAKFEAIKEFAEKAVAKLTKNYSAEYCHWIDDTIDNLVKEMAGEK